MTAVVAEDESPKANGNAVAEKDGATGVAKEKKDKKDKTDKDKKRRSVGGGEAVAEVRRELGLMS